MVRREARRVSTITAETSLRQAQMRNKSGMSEEQAPGQLFITLALDSRDVEAGRRGGRGWGHVPGRDIQRPDGPAVVSHPPEGRSSRLEGTATRDRVQHQREHAVVRRTAGGLRLRLPPERV